VRNVLPDIAEFRGTGIHAELDGRKLEIWEGLFAVAQQLGGQKWVNMCMASFLELTARGSSERVLTPRQALVAHAAELLEAELKPWAERGFIPGQFLTDALRRIPEYREYSPEQLSKTVADELVPMGIRTHQVRGLTRRGYPLDRMSGYYPAEIMTAWDAIRPDDPEDVQVPGFEDPFDISGLNDEAFEYLPGDEPQPARKAPPKPKVAKVANLPAVERKFLRDVM
jgi:hypothetical protein